MVDIEKLKTQLIKHEGMRLFPYEDTVGKITIGVGRNLTDRGITPTIVNQLLEEDILITFDEIQRYSWYASLNEVRQRALIDMMFNVGATKFAQFHHLIDALHIGDFDEAAHQMLDSQWAHQVGLRANMLANMIKTGVDVIQPSGMFA